MRPTPIIALLFCCFLNGGCRHVASGDWAPIGSGSAIDALPNPLPVPMLPREFVMDEVSDEVDNYFRILREQRIRLIDNVLTEGWLDTEPKIGSTLFEPWRRDSTRGFELAHATLQTVRRWARVRVIPADNRYLVDVKVYKELEDLLEPERALIGGQIFRYDNSLDSDRDEKIVDQPNKGWIPMGRDFSLEQKILSNIQSRIYNAANGPLTGNRRH